MKTTIGLWIDHRKAVVVTVAGNATEVEQILSQTDRHPSRTDGKPSGQAFEAGQRAADDVNDRKFQHHLNSYYDEVIAKVHSAEAILIFGPGEAKGEFRKRLEKERPSQRTVAVETTDKLTEPQIVAKVRGYFLLEKTI